MKKIFYVIIVTSITITSFAQQIVIQKTDGSNSKLDLNTIESINFIIPCPGTPTVDYGGKIYNTVLIGNQCWLKENLDVGTMINGNQTPDPTPGGTIEKYCYANLPANCEIYGGLYTWQESMQYVTTEGARGICPEGWHIPTEAEFDALSTFVGGDGNSLKAIDQGTGAGQGTDLYGFSALLAGNKETNLIFLDIGRLGHFWSSTSSSTNVPHYYLWNDRSDFTQHWGVYSTYGFSVRCIKDN